MISLRGVTKRYGDHLAVDNLSLEIPAGHLFAFLGPNGAGKTTTIKMMVGLLRPTSGTLALDGIDVVRETERANRRVGFVPDEPFLYDKLTGREFLDFTARMYGLSHGDAHESVSEQIARFELTGFVDDLCESYSHGMKQRIVFASAMVHRPRVLLVDEPMVGLDPRSMRLVKDLFREQSRRGLTIFMSTHTLSVAEEIADSVGIIHRSRLVFLGRVDELRDQLQRSVTSETATLEELFLQLTTDATVPSGETAPPDGKGSDDGLGSDEETAGNDKRAASQRGTLSA